MLSIPGALKSLPDLPAKLAAEFEAIGKLPPEEKTEAVCRTLGNIGFALVPIKGGKYVLRAIKVKRAVKASKWVFGSFKSHTKWANQLAKRGRTKKQITEAIIKGKSFNAVNNVNKANAATRYIYPTTGQSVVIDNVTKKILHLGGPGFKY